MNVTKESLIEIYYEKDIDELLAMHQSGELSDDGYSAIEFIFKERSINIPARNVQSTNNKTDDLFMQYWKGDKGLKSTFFVVYLVGSILALFLSYALSIAFSTLFQTSYFRPALFTFLTCSYLLFVLVVLWRNSRQTKNRLIKYLSLSVLGLLITFPFYLYATLALNRIS